jgi:hypothetical protein
VSKIVSVVVREQSVQLALERLRCREMFCSGLQNGGIKMRNLFLIATSLSLVATAYASPALAAWGCGSQLYPGGHFRTYGYASKAEAGAAMLRFCGQQHRDCRIVGCSDNINNEDQANARWPITTTNQVHCGAGTDVTC